MKKIKIHLPLTNLHFTVAFLLVGLVGSVLLVFARAAPPVVSSEAEAGNKTGAAGIVSDSRASGGGAIKFGTNAVMVEKYGAKGDGTTDDTAAIQRGLDALQSGQLLIFSSGKTYPHNAVLNATKAGGGLAGGGTLLATNQQASTLDVAADNVSIRNLTFKMKSTTQRWSAPAQTMVYFDHHAGDSISSVLIDGSPSAGLFIYSAHDYTATDVTVQNTRADAIHNTFGSYNGTIIRPIIKNVGDDGVAVVSYLQDGAICHDITVSDPKFYGSTNGRAYSVVGGKNVTFTNIYADSSNAASVYIGSEGSPYYTYGTDTIKVLGGTISNANTNSSVDHGAILILGGETGYAQNNITISNLAISNTRSTASRQVSLLNYNGTMSQIQLDHITITGGGSTVFGTLSVPANAYNTLSWTRDGTPLPDHRGF